jgi:Polyketide cyclase / dehydrase and lipid transport
MRTMKLRGVTAGALAAASAAYTAVRYRRWHLRWGATDDELAMALPGDEMVQRPHFTFTRAITIQARPEEIWPWLVQIGYGRAGWYSYDLLDNLGRHSAEQILPELQRLQVGDWISMGGKPRPTTAMRVKAFAPNLWLLWEHQGCPWVWLLKPIDQETTRLITRGRNRYTWKDVVFPLGPVLMELGDPFMMRKQLHNLKRRAEHLAAVRRPATAGTAGQEVVAVDGSMLAPNRGRLAVLEAEADIDRSPEAVFDYCSDPSHEPEWNVKMTKAEQLTDGPIGVGARWRMAFASAPSVLSECVRFERPRVWELVGRSKVMTSGWRGRVLPSGDGARLLLRMELQLHGPLGLATPLLGRRMQPELERDIATIKTKLEQTA